MRSAEEWAKECQYICSFGNEATCGCGDGNACEEFIEMARAIQADAIKRAAAMAFGDEYLCRAISSLIPTEPKP